MSLIEISSDSRAEPCGEVNVSISLPLPQLPNVDINAVKRAAYQAVTDALRDLNRLAVRSSFGGTADGDHHCHPPFQPPSGVKGACWICPACDRTWGFVFNRWYPTEDRDVIRRGEL